MARMLLNAALFQVAWFAAVLGAAYERAWLGPLVLLPVLAVNLMPLVRHMPSNLFWAGSTAVSGLVLQAGDPLDRADIVVEPDLAEIDYVLPRCDDLLARGRAATLPIIPLLQTLLI